MPRSALIASLPNLITLARLLSVPVAVWLIRDQRVTFLFAPLARTPACGPILPQPAPSARRPNILRALHRQVMT